MNLAPEIKDILVKRGILDIKSLKNITRNELKELNLTNEQINEIIIYLQLNGFDIRRTSKKKKVES